MILEDCFKAIFRKLSPKQEQIIVKTVVFVAGIVIVGLAGIVEKFGQVLPVCYFLVGNSLLLSIFILLFLVIRCHIFNSVGSFTRSVYFGNIISMGKCKGNMKYPKWNSLEKYF